MKVVWLSHLLNNKHLCYNNAYNIKIEHYKNNEMQINMPLHSGTHIDFPLHINNNGNSLNNYNAEDFIFNHAFVKVINTENNYFKPEQLTGIPEDVDFLIIKTGKVSYTNTGISGECAKFIQNNFKNIKCIGTNSLSINALQDKEPGREAHREFLNIEPAILIVEDMDLSAVSEGKLGRVIVAPLRVEAADGVPVTIFAEVE